MLLSNFRSRELWYTKFVRNDIVWSSFMSTISDWFVTWKYLSIFCSFWNLNVKVAANANFWIWQHFRFESEMFIARKRRYQLQHAILGSDQAAHYVPRWHGNYSPNYSLFALLVNSSHDLKPFYVFWGALQFEVFCQFFIAYYDSNGSYEDNLRAVVARYGLTISCFAFDLTTSFPWSYLDYWAYQARFTQRIPATTMFKNFPWWFA